jgi:hypothetical protein
MSQKRLPPPDAVRCLHRPGERKGGTLLVEEVTSLAAHRARVCSPDGYRPGFCARCGHGVLHVHDYRGRVLLEMATGAGCSGTEWLQVVRYACAHADCGAVWQMLPAFVARHLWRAWATVERATMGGAPASSPVPPRTRERWGARLLAPALLLVQLFASETGSRLEALAKDVGLEATRHALVAAYAVVADARPGARLASVAAVVHRLARGVRLM